MANNIEHKMTVDEVEYGLKLIGILLQTIITIT